MSVVNWTPARLRTWAYQQQMGLQQTSQWLFYPKYGKLTDPLPKTKIQRDHAFTEDNHYEVKGCNLHDKAEWIRYVRTDGDYSDTASSQGW